MALPRSLTRTTSAALLAAALAVSAGGATVLAADPPTTSDPGAAADPVALLNKDKSAGVRVEVAASLGMIKDRSACDALLDALHDW